MLPATLDISVRVYAITPTVKIWRPKPRIDESHQIIQMLMMMEFVTNLIVVVHPFDPLYNRSDTDRLDRTPYCIVADIDQPNKGATSGDSISASVGSELKILIIKY